MILWILKEQFHAPSFYVIIFFYEKLMSRYMNLRNKSLKYSGMHVKFWFSEKATQVELGNKELFGHRKIIHWRQVVYYLF